MDLTCILCRRQLDQSVMGYDCPACGRSYPVRHGIASFSKSSYYYNIVPREPMLEYLATLDTTSWDEAFYQLQATLPKKSQGIFNNVLAFHRAGWKFLLPRGDSVRALDLGCGWGCISVALARSCSEVVSVDLTYERLRSLKAFAAFEGLNNLSFIHAGDGPLPFPDASFDVVVLNGVLEWVPDGTDGDPREVQLRYLREVARVLRENGVLYLAIENRMALRYVLRREDHVGLYWSSFLPRRLSDAYSRWVRNKGYRTYTYGRGGYRRLLKESGFRDAHFFCPLPDYRYPSQMSNLEPGTGYPLDDKTLSNWARPFVYSFSIVTGKSTRRRDGFEDLIQTLQQRLEKTGLGCSRYLIQKSEAILFLNDSQGNQYVARLPYGDREAGRSRSNAAALKFLRAHGGISGVEIPDILLEERLGRDFVTVETKVPGVDLRNVLQQSNAKTVLNALTDFLGVFGREHLSAKSGTSGSIAAVAAMSDAIGQHLVDRSLRSELTALSKQVVGRLEGLEFTTLWAHGDFNLGNCLWNARTNELQSLVDWDQMQADAVPGWDVVKLIGGVRRHRKMRKIADPVGDIAMNGLTAEEHELWNRYWTKLGVPPVELPVVLATYWLRVTAYGFLHSNRHLSQSWVERSIRPALAAVTQRLATNG